MKNIMMIAALALIAPLANAEDQAATETAAPQADVAAVEVIEDTTTTAEGTKVEAMEIMEEEAASTTDAAK